MNFLKALTYNYILFVFLSWQTSVCAKPEVYDIPQVTTQIQIDGSLNETAWKSGLILELNYQTAPGDNSEPPVKTTAYLLEDGNNLYVAFMAKDPEPSAIRAYRTDRDKLANLDQVIIKLDTFNDSKRAFQFSVSPLGVQADAIIDEQSDNLDPGWDAIWQSAGQLTSQGYQVEIKIPLDVLRFNQKQGGQTWGIQLERIWPRDVVYKLASASYNRDSACQICQFDKAKGFHQIESPLNLTLIPSMTLVKSDSREANAQARWVNGSTEEKTSLDLRWGISQNTTLNVTVNPDFSQVEADSLQLDVNSLSALALDEKRPFFVDGAGYFNNWSRLVYSRIFEEPKAGIKLTGQSGSHSYGLMNLIDQHTNLLFPYEYGVEFLSLRNLESNNTMFRYRYDFSGNHTLGTTMTLRQAEGYENRLLSMDGKFWFDDKNYFKFQVLDSDTDYPESVTLQRQAQAPRINDTAYSLNFTHSSRHWEWLATYHRFGKDFRADAGFINFSNWQRGSISGQHSWYAEKPDSWWKQVDLRAAWLNSKELDGKDIDQITELNFQVEALYESAFGLDLIKNQQTYINLSQPLAQTEFQLNNQLLWAEMRPIADMGISFEYYWGDDIDYERSEAAKVKTWLSDIDYQLSDRLNTQFEYIDETLEGRAAPIYQIQLTNLRLAYQMNDKSNLRLTLQGQRFNDYQQVTPPKNLASQLLYSYKINPFTLIYLGYSDQYVNQLDTNRLTRNKLKRTDKTLFVKFSYAWQA